jgi:hypothetical protein
MGVCESIGCVLRPGGERRSLYYCLSGGYHIKDRSFHAELGRAGTPGWIVMNGKITADGKSTIVAGDSRAVLNNPTPGSPMGYTVSAKFDENFGIGKRNEDRPCTVTFSKR